MTISDKMENFKKNYSAVLPCETEVYVMVFIHLYKLLTMQGRLFYDMVGPGWDQN